MVYIICDLLPVTYMGVHQKNHEVMGILKKSPLPHDFFNGFFAEGAAERVRRFHKSDRGEKGP